MVLIEAQINGVPCITSTEVPESATISNKIEYISLNDDIEIWRNKILQVIKDDSELEYNNRKDIYDIRKVSTLLEEKYLKLLENIDKGKK